MSVSNGHANGVHRFGPPAIADRLPAQNIEAEQSVLGSILVDDSLLERIVPILSAEDFYRNTHQVIYREIVDLHAQDLPVDVITLADSLGRRDQLDDVGGIEFLMQLAESVPHTANAVYHAGIVREKADLRRIEERGQEIIRLSRSGEITAQHALERAERLLGGIALPDQRDTGFNDPAFALRPWPDAPDEALFHGVIGEVLRLIAPHTEADPMAVLAQFLACFGNIVGRRPNWRAEATRQGANLFVAIVGATATGRKGTSWDHVARVQKGCDPTWMVDDFMGGLSSGEGLINAVRDPIMKRERVPGDPRLGGGGYQDREIDPGVEDKRLLVVETEMSSVLAVMNRDGTTLSEIIRKSWDGSNLRSAARHSPLRATHPHISIIGHITGDELRRKLTATETANGFANRFLWVCSRRSKLLPHGGKAHLIDWAPVHRHLREAIRFATDESADTLVGRSREEGLVFVRDDEANKIWDQVYGRLTSGAPGLLGAITSRGAPQVMRVAMIYAILDFSYFIQAHHLLAGLAFWKYCEQSAAFIFGESLGSPGAEKVLEELRASKDGITTAQLRRKLFGGREPAGGIDDLLMSLYRSGLVTYEEARPNGRKVVVWRAL